MGKRGNERFAPVRKELFSLFKELNPISDEMLQTLKSGQSKGKIKKIERLVRSYNEGLEFGYTGLKLQLLVERPGSIAPQEYRNNLVFETARKQNKKFVILWESGKYTHGFTSRDEAYKAIDAILNDEVHFDKPETEIRTYARKVVRYNLQGAGYIYIAQNESLPDMVKIGMTTTSVAQRLKELSNTSVPTPFSPLAIFELSKNILSIEQELHIAFQKDRIHRQREFFRTDEPRSYCKKVRDYLIETLGNEVKVRMFPNLEVNNKN